MIESSVIGSSGNIASAAQSDAGEKARLAAAVKDFEAVFVSYMLKSMRSSLNSNEMFGDSFGGDLMDGMFDVELARSLSKGNGLGLGDALLRKLGERDMPQSLPAPPVQQEPQEPEATRVSPAVRERTHGRTLEPFEEMIRDAAKAHDVDPSLIKALIMSESSGRPSVMSNRSAKGLMQLMDSTAADMGVKDVWDPRENILGGTKYLKVLLDRFDGNLPLALASYNAGPGTVEKYGGIPPFRETREYVERVTKFMRQFAGENDGQTIEG